MQQQIGRRLTPLAPADLQARLATASAVTVDLGAGSGRFVLAQARAHPDQLVIGVDADQSAMAESSRRAARRPERGGAANALFVVAAAEALPGPFEGIADLLTLHFPWGSLLHGASGQDGELLHRLAALVHSGGRVRLLLSSAPRDARRGDPTLDPQAVARAWQARGFTVLEVAEATRADADAAHSGWGRRLLAEPAGDRLAWRIELVLEAATIIAP